MDKIIEKVVEDFKRASKGRREKIAGKYGFTVEEFIAAYGISEPRKEEDTTDIVVAFDTTGSMAGYIASVRNHVKELIPKMFKESINLKMKIVAFGDYCDMKSPKDFGKAYEETLLTDDSNLLISFVDRNHSTGGGDSDEFYELVIKKIVEETPWRNGKKSVLLIADYTPHPVGYQHYNCENGKNTIDWRVEAEKAAKKGIQFDTLKIIPAHTWYDELSKMTGGACMNFTSVSQIHNIVEASTYMRSSVSSFKAKYRGAAASGDEELVGAMKCMFTTTSNFSESDRVELNAIEKEEREKKTKK